MTQGQDPYEESGGFTPYRPSDAPQAEAPAAGAPPPEAPLVPYGSASGGPVVPYGTAFQGASISTFTSTSSSRSRWIGWLVGIAVLVTTCGGVVTGIVAFFADLGSDSSSGTSPEVVVPEVEIPSFTVPTFELPTPNMRAEIFANDLQRSQCLVGTGFDPSSNDGVSNLEVTDCAGAHNAQVLEIRVLGEREAADYDFADSDQGNRSCFPLFSRAQKALFRGTRYTLLSFTETATPGRGDKVACLVVRTDGGLIRGFLPR